jgi:hypothetical protein
MLLGVESSRLMQNTTAPEQCDDVVNGGLYRSRGCMQMACSWSAKSDLVSPPVQRVTAFTQQLVRDEKELGDVCMEPAYPARETRLRHGPSGDEEAKQRVLRRGGGVRKHSPKTPQSGMRREEARAAYGSMPLHGTPLEVVAYAGAKPPWSVTGNPVDGRRGSAFAR